MRTISSGILLLFVMPLLADGPGDNVPEKVRPIPPLGSPIPDEVRVELKVGLANLQDSIRELPSHLKDKPALLQLSPDVEIYEKAVRYALDYNEMYIDKNRDDIKAARELLKIGMQRARELKEGRPSWHNATGLVVRGYRSKIDGSVQPYGLVVPNSYTPLTGMKFRLDFWWHGRGETLTELNFITQRSNNFGEFTPKDTIVLHPYGRYCNANKFAGEIDTLECLEHVKKHYNIDPYRIIARGFSMGGAACWQFATHYPSLFAAAAPGAGFAETPEFLDIFQKEKVQPTWYEKKLWGLYNSTQYAVNLYNVPTIAYSGENDKQKQAAEVMARELDKEDIDLVHIIGPKTGHSYHPQSKIEINRRIDAIAKLGRGMIPYSIKFTTPTLRYNHCSWLRIDGLEKHWDFARVDAELLRSFDIQTKGVTALSIDVPGEVAYTGIFYYPLSITIDHQRFTIPKRKSDRSIRVSFEKNGDRWEFVNPDEKKSLRKIHGLQGPIDDAFLDAFIFVKPTGKPMHEATGKWVVAELDHAVKHWRQQFRGDAVIKTDQAITAEDIAKNNLVLWGDPASNAVLGKVLEKLPIQWTDKLVKLGEQTYPAESHVPLLIFPNPLNPAKYVVLNSGFTYREYDYLNNARQVPKLPDYAILDVRTPPSSRAPGRVVRAGFFGERWELQAEDGQ